MHLNLCDTSEAADTIDPDTSDLSTTGRSSTVSSLYPLRASASAAQLDRGRQIGSSHVSSQEISSTTIRSSLPSPTHPQGHSFIDLVHTSMNTSRAGSTGQHSRTPSEVDQQQPQHARQESGYQSSTIGTNSIPPMTIGVKRGSDLLASRRGPQITGNPTSTTSIPARAGSAPPHSGAPGYGHSQSASNINIQEIFDYNEYHQRATEFNAIIDSGEVPAFKPIYVGGPLPAEEGEDSQDGSEKDDDNDNEESEDDGIEPAENYKQEMESEVDNYRLPDDADPALSVLNKSQAQQQQQAQQPFYQLQRDDDHGRGNRSPLSACSEPRGQLLSTEALAARMLYGIDDNYQPIDPNGPMALAHNEAMRQHHKALLDRRGSNSINDNSNALLSIPKVKKVSSGTLGSPFNQQQQQAAASGAAGPGTNAVGVQTVPITKQPIPKRISSRDKVNPATGRHRHDKHSSNSNTSKQAFPSKGDSSMDSSVATLTGASGTGRKEPSSRSKKPPSSNARYNNGTSGTIRGRKSSDASERSVKKDDLLGKLSDALRAEKRLVKLYQDELQSAEAQMAKILEAEAARDEEMTRLESRHARDKQLISALKLKVERLEAELMRAEDVPEHEAEAYLDLLSGAGGGVSGNKKHLKFDNDNSSVSYDEDELDRDSEAEERSMRALVEEQDALDGTWTKQMMEKEDKRRKAFAKKRKQHLATMNDSSATEDENLVEARLAEAQAQALAQAGLDQRPNHTRKLSFKDTLKRTFGLKSSDGSTDRVNIIRFDSAPAATALPASNAINIPASTPTMYTTGPDLARTVSSPPPTISLPPIPIDPAVNAKDAKAQHRRLTKLAAEKNTLSPRMPDGTYGRSASMDVQGTPFYTPVSLSETALPLSGYSSDSDVAQGGKTGKGLTGLFRLDRPPPSNNTRYGIGIEGVRPNSGRARKLSWGRAGTATSGGGNVGGGGGGFFKHRNIDAGRPLGTPRIQVSHPGTPGGGGGDRWRRGSNATVPREEKTWSQQLPQDTTVIHR